MGQLRDGHARHFRIGAIGVSLFTARGYLKASKGYVHFINPLDIRGDAAGDVCPIRYVLFPKYTPGAVPALIPIRRAEAAFALHRVCFKLFGCDRVGLDVLAAMIRGASCYRLIAGEIHRTCDLVQELVEGSRTQCAQSA